VAELGNNRSIRRIKPIKMKIIELLDGSTWDMDTVLAKMQDDSLLLRATSSKNALSSSACKLLLTSPKTYHYVTKYGSEDSDAFAVGRLGSPDGS
jgi:hypothetical protein